MRVVFCGTGWLPIVDAIRAALRERGLAASVTVRDPGRPLAPQVAEADVLLPSNGRIDASVIAAARGLRLIQQPAAGIDGVDFAAAQARGIPVCNAPGANHVAMAETALLLLLMVARRVGEARARFARGELGVPVGSELRGRHLGIVGLGRSGTALATAAGALGMRVTGLRSSSTSQERANLFAEADAISLHCPLTPQTRAMIDEAAFARMKPGAWLINCARGAIIDRAALERALTSGRLGGVGLDAHWQEPADPADSLYQHDNVVTLPHVGGSTTEAFARIAAIVADNIARVQRGDEPRFRII
jgi:phosphoglycerate dehydrogenase-like enzyme